MLEDENVGRADDVLEEAGAELSMDEVRKVVEGALDAIDAAAVVALEDAMVRDKVAEILARVADEVRR